MKYTNIEIGERIKKIRVSKGLTMDEFGAIIDNTKQSLVSRWERGVNLPNKKRLKMIADFANISVDEILDDGVRVVSLSDEIMSAIINGDTNLILKKVGELTQQIDDLQQEIQSLKENKNEK